MIWMAQYRPRTHWRDSISREKNLEHPLAYQVEINRLMENKGELLHRKL